MKYHGFLSYNSLSSINVEKLNQILKNSNLSIFYDKDINFAETTTKKINDGLSNSKNLILFIDNNGISESYQRRELNTFHDEFYIKSNSDRKILVFIFGDVNDDLIPLELRSIDRIFCKSISTIDNGIVNLCRLLQANFFYSSKEEIIRPYHSEDFKILRTDTIKWYNENYEDFYETWKDNIPKHIDAFIKKVKDHSNNPIVLDAGTGPGHHSNYLTKNGFNVIGIDLANKMIELAQKNKINSTQKFYHLDFTKLQHIPNITKFYFDGIWASGTFIHINEEYIRTHLTNCKAYLKKGGILGVTFQINFASRIDEDGRFFEVYKLIDIERIIKSIGFTDIDVHRDLEYNVKKSKQKVKEWVCFICKT